MTSELHNFKNITCASSSNTIIYPTPTPYYNSSYYFNDIKEINPPISANLISDLAYNISTVAYPIMQQLIEEFTTDAIKELNVSNATSYNFYTTEYPENSSIANITDLFLVNETFSNISFLNGTIGNYRELNFTDFKDIFVDYLTYILYPFNNNDTDIVANITEVDIFNITKNISFSGTMENGFEFFRSAVISLLSNISDKYDSDRVDQELANIYNEINTSVTFLQENITTNQSTICKTTEAPYYFANHTTTTTIDAPNKLNYSMCARLRSLCWETMFGQELIKLTVMDLIMTILSTLAIDFVRGIFVRIMNRCWCWDLEKKFPQYGDFKVAENILHLVNNQGMVWMGMFFSPGLVALNVIKLYIMMYFRAWAVLTCNVPHEVIFRASRSNNFYYALLLMMLFLCVLPVGYAIVWIKPSWHCGPFSKYKRIFHIFTETIRNTVPESFQRALDYIASPGIVIPLLVLLILIIYYLISLTGALREANDDLKIQLRRERTEERRKMFQIADRRRGGSGESNELSNTPFTRWKKLIGTLPSGKSFDETPKQESDDNNQPVKEKNMENKNKDEEQNAEDGTDTEQHESLPDDSMVSKHYVHKSVRPSLSWGNSDFPSSVNKILKKNHGKIDRLPSGSMDSSDMKHVQIQEAAVKHSTLHRCDTFELKKNQQNKKRCVEQVMPSTSRDMRQDSGSSVWSDNIPVITISKTESDENILRETKSKNEKTNLEKSNDKLKEHESAKFKPKIKCALKKQSTEFDEDTICHFNKDLERNLTENKIFKAVAEEDLEILTTSNEGDTFPIREHAEIYRTENLGNSSSSEDTEFKETSVGTILNFPYTAQEIIEKDEGTGESGMKNITN
ncbi:hypothetical protein NQ314_014408 [Rhamnusium bicolor]|uniref:TMC domain-containing protein n=1 Tax=Rhamnusium bicolor TaxID=1586634 RepID=A0AAV8X258_9CUCU|nr:hypothetical protein NQ314_014408 [Rhamnusium bicolor]